MEYNKKDTVYLEAEKRVKKIKNFYNHLQIFVIMMLVLVLFSDMIISFFEAHISSPDSLRWIKANIWVNVLLWLFGLVIHGIYVFKFKANAIDRWEKKKLDEIMKEKK
jgi:uncharacterized membrane protein (DUF485 family)